MKKQISCETSWGEDHRVFVYTESLEACRLEKHRFGSLADPSTPFEGRIFDSGSEARWRFLPHANGGKWAAWITRENAEGEEPARRITRRYYLRGISSSDGQGARHLGRGRLFHEARYPHVRFHYPVGDGQHQDRAYVEVAEYWRVEPDWSCSVVDATQELALPLLFAHRFFGVGVGRGLQQQED